MTWSRIATALMPRRQIGRRPPPGIEEDVPLDARLVDLHSGRRAGRAHGACTGWYSARRNSAARPQSIGDDSMVYAALFQFFYLRGAIFFGCVGIFSNLFRGEMLEKTLHYYYHDARAPRVTSGRVSISPD